MSHPNINNNVDGTATRYHNTLGYLSHLFHGVSLRESSDKAAEDSYEDRVADFSFLSPKWHSARALKTC